MIKEMRDHPEEFEAWRIRALAERAEYNGRLKAGEDVPDDPPYVPSEYTVLIGYEEWRLINTVS